MSNSVLRDQITQVLQPIISGRGRIVLDGEDGFILIPRSDGMVVSCTIVEADELLVRTGSGLLLGLPMDQPFDPVQPAEEIQAILDGRLVEFYSTRGGMLRLAGYKLTFSGGGGIATGDPEDSMKASFEYRLPHWDPL